MPNLIEDEIAHPSYGTVQFSRVTIGGKGEHRLFGSSLRNHMSTVMLTIREATQYTRYGEDHAYSHKEIIRVELSSAQFAELLTTMNVGSGVTCTIRHKGGDHIENPPHDEVEVDRAHSAFKARLKTFVKDMEKKTEEISAVLDKKNINKGDRKNIISMITRILQEIKGNMPFALDQFNEAVERVTSAAKAEVDAFVMDAITRTGLKQLKQMGSDDPFLLSDGKVKE